MAQAYNQLASSHIDASWRLTVVISFQSLPLSNKRKLRQLLSVELSYSTGRSFWGGTKSTWSLRLPKLEGTGPTGPIGRLRLWLAIQPGLLSLAIPPLISGTNIGGD